MNKGLGYKVNGKILEISNSLKNRKIVFDFPIDQVVELCDSFVVSLEPDIGKIYNENVFCVTLKDGIVWQVEAIKKFTADSPYTNVSVKNGALSLYSWSGEIVEVDPKNGKIVNKSFSRW